MKRHKMSTLGKSKVDGLAGRGRQCSHSWSQCKSWPEGRREWKDRLTDLPGLEYHPRMRLGMRAVDAWPLSAAHDSRGCLSKRISLAV